MQIISTHRPIFKHPENESIQYTPMGHGQIEIAPDWIVHDEHFGINVNAGRVKVVMPPSSVAFSSPVQDSHPASVTSDSSAKTPVEGSDSQASGEQEVLALDDGHTHTLGADELPATGHGINPEVQTF